VVPLLLALLGDCVISQAKIGRPSVATQATAVAE